MAVTVRTLENFIGGEWVASTGESGRAVVSPVTGETLAECALGSRSDVDVAVAANDLAPLRATRDKAQREALSAALAAKDNISKEEAARRLAYRHGVHR